MEMHNSILTEMATRFNDYISAGAIVCFAFVETSLQAQGSLREV